MFLYVNTVNSQYMKKGYHDYIPVVKEEKKEIKKEVIATHKPKYIKSHGGHMYKFTDERGMVVAGTDVLMFGNKLPSWSNARYVKPSLKMDTKNYIRYNGHL